MRDDEIRRRLQDQNPWWRSAVTGLDPTSWTTHDPVLRRRSRWDLGYRANLLGDVGTQPLDDRLIVLRGPRRVGKSVLLKDLAAQLCSRDDVNPMQVVYMAVDGMRKQDMQRAMRLATELTRSVGNVRRAWLLDEVTAIRGWTESLKYLRDNTAFGDDTVVCTGSSWQDDADVERDLLAGRAGTGSSRRERLLLPMSFRDYVLTTGRELPLPEQCLPCELQSDDVAHAAAGMELFTDELDLAWQSYLSCGGFPRAVAEYHRDGAVSQAFINDLGAWLHRDVDADAPADSVPLLLWELHRRSTAPLNVTSTAEDLNYGSRTAFSRRLARLTHSYAGLWCHQVDDDGRRVAGAISKFYLTDPLLAWLGLRLRSGMPDPDMTQLSENAVCVALARAIDHADPGRWTADDSIGYAKTGSNNEIDLAPVPVPTPAGPRPSTPVESKWVSKGWRKEARTIEGKYHAGLLATKDLIDTSNPSWAIPAPLVALLLHG